MEKKIILLGLNEINFDFVSQYADLGYLPNFKSLLQEFGYSCTTSESKYELLEPWIQWVTIHTGLSYSEHQVFRLGDIVDRKDLKQLWEIADEKGLTVGAISPFNADNRLKDFKFFVPDPWTNAKPTGTNYLVETSYAVAQAVNDNANKKITLKSIFAILRAMIKTIAFRRYGHYFRSVMNARKVGGRALILDSLLADLFLYEWRKHKPDFSSLFLNTGAHFQHHYMFNSLGYKGKLKNPEWYCPAKQDPLKKILITYDKIIGELIKLNHRLIVCTGLHQNPHDHLTYYWRLKNHVNFLMKIGVDHFIEILPRMSRDFLIKFNDEEYALKAEVTLKSFNSVNDNHPIFSVDNRKNSLFVELVYPNEINKNFAIKNDQQTVQNFEAYVAFVAIKNGEHDGIGYFIDTGRPKQDPKNFMPLKNVFNTIVNAFRVKKNELVSP